ncbi:MAG TPA: UDP-N-acetylglucosamine diphosphorylase/glucosamine-1-phosphate N-acetyltransferase [Betaproteobacteria bacterium]|nr:UDP-N-acetylglucosamine diphosphorylase/glucosamine-1-phosphate N-acetyltransferase [Betaproteobacteria bacterium]
MAIENIVILAAGKGTRMFSRHPKVLHPLAGQPLLAHVIGAARALRPRRIIVVHGHGGDAVAAAFPAADLHWVRQEPQQGTGHAMLTALPALTKQGVTLILYGDVPLIACDTLRPLARHAQEGGLALLTAHLTDPAGYGRIVRDTGGGVQSIIEEKDATPEQRQIHEINTGFMALPTRHLADWLPRLDTRNTQGEYYLTDIVPLAAAQRIAITTHHPQREWEIHGVNNKQQLAELERVFQRESARELLAQGVTLADPARIDIRGRLTCAQDVSIDVNCIFEGEVALGENVTIGAHCVIRNATIGKDTVIEAFSLIEQAMVGDSCRIGPFARLRPGARLAATVHVGNFVEIKNSNIGDNSKINHLSYIGDSDLGKNINVGAGSITCNYDGANKHRTTIEDNVFIGSDTQLVAPVTVKKGATVGAGSTITRDVPADGLTLSRSKQVSVPSWRRPVKKSQ